jgi:hypothetical protein
MTATDNKTLWEEKNLTDQQTNLSKNVVNVSSDIITKIKKDLTNKEQNDTTEIKWTRNCPKCDKELLYKNERQLKKSIRNNTICKKCSAVLTEAWKHNSQWKIHLQHISTIWSKNCHRCGCIQTYKNKRYFDRGKKKNAVCRKCQLIIRKPTSIYDVNFNPKACEYLNKLNEERGWNLQHALNGGEQRVLRYWLDGYDKKKNIVVEYDEPLHKYKKEYDLNRQIEIIKFLNCDFYRYNEKTKILSQVHSVDHVKNSL